MRKNQYLKCHSNICCLMTVVLEAIALGRRKKAQTLWKPVATCVWEHEDQVQPVFDVFEFILTLRSKIC
ncbi:MAG: hypothetical protein GX754_08710 [Clostridiaceae bacterium]|nr:hypothetical protein [Clostridiaceae bacterium]